MINIREDAIFENNLFRHSYLSYNTGCGSLFVFVGPAEIGSSLPCEEGYNRLRKKPYNENRLTNREQNQWLNRILLRLFCLEKSNGTHTVSSFLSKCVNYSLFIAITYVNYKQRFYHSTSISYLVLLFAIVLWNYDRLHIWSILRYQTFVMGNFCY